MDMVPRISRAQKMDALSSMANIAGYRAVIEAGNNFGRFFTGQITAAGKVPPAKVLVIGAGVAGLAAIGTAQSLGAIVRAFDVRPEVAEQIESMGAEFLMLEFEEDGSGEGGYAKPASPEFIEKEMQLFREQAPEVDIVITTALIPGRPAPKLWPAEMVGLMKPGSVVVDLAAEQGGNCDLTEAGKIIESGNGVKIVGYTDFPSRMATQSSTLYATNIRHMLDDLTPEKDGILNVNMEDDVIRGATICHDGTVTFPPPPPKIQAIGKQEAAPKPVELTAEEKAALELEKEKSIGRRQAGLLAIGGLFMLLIGAYAPASFMQHFIVFALACFVGFQVIWNVSHSLHTPLMAVTNAISGIIIIGALLQLGSPNNLSGHSGGDFCLDCHYQYCGRIYGNPPYAGDVPEELRGVEKIMVLSENIVTALYIAASVLFILSLGGLSGQESAKRAVWYGIVGMAVAVIGTIFGPVLPLPPACCLCWWSAP